jgi:hypothetical protein
MRYGRYARSEDVAKTRREATISAPRSSHLSPAEQPYQPRGGADHSSSLALPRTNDGRSLVVVVVTSEAYYTELHFARKFCQANDEHFGLPA